MNTRASIAPMTRTECFAVLGVKMSASPSEIRRAYRQLVLKLHPDRAGDESATRQAFLDVVEAYKRLKALGELAGPEGLGSKAESGIDRIQPHEMPAPPPTRQQKCPSVRFPAAIVAVGIPVALFSGVWVFTRTYDYLMSPHGSAEHQAREYYHEFASACGVAAFVAVMLGCLFSGYAIQGIRREAARALRFHCGVCGRSIAGNTSGICTQCGARL